MGDFEEVERLQAGIRTRLLRTARSGRHELRGISGPAVLPMLCAAAFGPALADADGPAPGLARMGVLVSVGADVLARLLEGASSRARSASADAPDPTRSLEVEISRSVREVLDAGGPGAGELRSDIAMVMREIDAGGTAFRAAIEAGDEELEREVLAALESLGAEFGDMAFMLSDLARGVQVRGSQGWPVVSLTVTARPLTDLAAGLARLDNRDQAAVRQRLADAPGQAHLLIRELTRSASRLVLIVDQFERVFAADGAYERAERAAFVDAVSAATPPRIVWSAPRPGAARRTRSRSPVTARRLR